MQWLLIVVAVGLVGKLAMGFPFLLRTVILSTRRSRDVPCHPR